MEKDYWVTFALKNLAKSSLAKRAVFKGGTSLSKAYKIAKRFSEDIDFAIITTDKSNPKQKKQILIELELTLASSPFTEIDMKRQTIKKDVFRRTHWEYPIKMDGDLDPAKSRLMLELTSNAKTNPHSKFKIHSFIADYLNETKRAAEVKEFDLESFEILVLSHKRTFAEKVVATVNACFEDEETFAKLKEKIRHLYDLTILLDEPEIKFFVGSKDFLNMIDEAREADSKIPHLKEFSKKPWRSSLIFKNPKKVMAELANTYNNELRPLVFDSDNMPSIKSIENMLKIVSEEKTL